MIKQAYPLSWPLGWRRTAVRRRSRFGTYNKKPTVAAAVDELMLELDRMGAYDVVVSTNLVLRIVGLPRSGQAEPKDPGAAVYFKRDGTDHVLPCDTFDKVGCNLYALARTVSALRQMERDGCAQIVGQAFTGFKALPPDTKAARADWQGVLGVQVSDGYDKIRARYLELVKRYHPDNAETGDAAEFMRVKAAWDEYDRLCCNGG
jgi:hypothetical protein